MNEHMGPLCSGADRQYKQQTQKRPPGARPTIDISIEFEIRPNFAVLWFKIYSSDHNKMLHTSRQCNCHDVCDISLWLVEYILN